MSIKIYKDEAANSIFIEDANGAQFLNSLQASVPTTTVTIKKTKATFQSHVRTSLWRELHMCHGPPPKLLCTPERSIGL